MTLEDHLACPNCGYDLHGIPEVRCPECGFRYDVAALRSMPASPEWIRLVCARIVIVRAAIAVALAVPAVLDRLGITGLAWFCIIGVVYVAAFSTWTAFTDLRHWGAWSIPATLMAFVGIAALIGPVVIGVPWLSLLVSAAVLAYAYADLTRCWPQLPPPGNTRLPELRRSAVRYSLACTILLILAPVLLVIGFLGG